MTKKKKKKMESECNIYNVSILFAINKIFISSFSRRNDQFFYFSEKNMFFKLVGDRGRFGMVRWKPWIFVSGKFNRFPLFPKTGKFH
jgi:hypothetical protein